MEGLRTTTKTLRKVLVPAEIRTGPFPNASSERYHCEMPPPSRLCYCSRGRLTARQVYVRFEDEDAGLAPQPWGPQQPQEAGGPLGLVLLCCHLQHTPQTRQSVGPVAKSRSIYHVASLL
jgi:hypothetical protein